MKQYSLVFRIIVFASLIGLVLGGCGKDMKGENTMVNGELIVGEDIIRALVNEQYEQLYSQFSEQLADAVSLKDFMIISKDFVAGDQNFEIMSLSNVNGYDTYIWQNNLEGKGINVAFDAVGTIQGLLLSPLESHPDTDELYTEVIYNLPFADEWYVFWGGHSVLMNYHYEYEHMRYAYDFIKTENQVSFTGDPLNNENYYTFNADVFAPADGKVVKVVNHIADNIPGQFNEQEPEGNMVIIEHAHNEFSFIAHFKQQSITVSEGDTVTMGQLIGKAGNSGNSSEPHIHFQVSKKMEGDKEIIIPIAFSSGKQWVKGELAHN